MRSRHKSFLRFAGVDMSFSTYRIHDPGLGRGVLSLSKGWLQVDPKAELGYHMSPFNSMQNNPILYVDPNGDWVHIAIGAGIGGLANLGVQAYKGNIDSW